MMAIWLTVAAFSAADESAIDKFFAEFVAKREHIESLQATFTQVNVTPDDTLRYEGRVAYVRPRRILFEYFDPKEVWAVDGRHVYNYQEHLEQLEVFEIGDSAQAEAFYIAFDNDAERLRKTYEVSLLGPTSVDCGERILKLAPKADDDESDTGPFREIYLDLRAEDLLPCRVRAVSDDDSEITITIHKYTVNPKDQRITAEFVVPPGTSIFKNGVRSDPAGEGGKVIPFASDAAEEPAEPAGSEKAGTP